MSGPVDVRAVLKRIAETNAAFATTADRDGIVRVGESMLAMQAADLGVVSVALTELIGATTEFRAGIAALVICQMQGAPQDIYDAVGGRFQKAADRLSAALANVGGAK